MEPKMYNNSSIENGYRQPDLFVRFYRRVDIIVPTINEVAVVIVGENVSSRDIVLKRRDGGQLQRVYEIHRS